MDEKAVSQRAFARLVGVTEGAVRKALQNGRLERCVRRDAAGRVWLDPRVGLREWAANHDPSKERR